MLRRGLTPVTMMVAGGLHMGFNSCYLLPEAYGDGGAAMVVNLQAWFIDELRLGNTEPTTTLLSMRGIPGLLESLLRPQPVSPAHFFRRVQTTFGSSAHPSSDSLAAVREVSNR